MKRVLCLLLSLLLLLFGCGPAEPDPDAVIRSIDQAMEVTAVSSDPKECIAAYEEQVQAYNQLVSAASLAYVRYCQDMTESHRAKEYGRLNAALFTIQNRLAKLEKELMDRWGYHRERGEAYADDLGRRSRQSAELGILREKEDELCRRYEQLSTEYRSTYQGRT